jgi:hypothetical protein
MLSAEGYFVFAICILGVGAYLYAYGQEPDKKMRRNIAFGITVICITVGVPMVMRLIGITQ